MKENTSFGKIFFCHYNIGSEATVLLQGIAYLSSFAYFLIFRILDIFLSAFGPDINSLPDCNTLKSGFPFCRRWCNDDEGGDFKQREHTV
jgi:hypothetical protein